MSPILLPTIAALRQQVSGWKKEGHRVAYVPTMGALHEGHVSLTRLARQHADRVVVSIFVNPTQFAPTEDFSAYPRTFESDVAKLRETGVEAVFHPTPAVMYPNGFCTTVSLSGPATVGLEDRFRPTHFSGVATVVSKLLIQSMPDVAIFGEKDYQQLAVIRRMALDLDIPVTILGGPTVRASSGLALSSRNAYLTPRERDDVAPVIHRSLSACAKDIRAGENIARILAEGSRKISSAGFAIDYLDLRMADSLAPVTSPIAVASENYRLLVAAKLEKVRLIDNIAV